MMKSSQLPLAFAFAAGVSLLATFALTSADQIVPRVAMISGLAILSFATRMLPEIVTALFCFLAFLVMDIAPADVIFSGFATGGIWLVFAGLIIGTAITQTGLGQQIATLIFKRTGSSYPRAIFLLCLSGLALGFLVPSTIPRVIVLMPIAVSLSSTMGYALGSRAQIGLAIAAATSTLMPTYMILTANLPTIVEYGVLETLYGIEPSYGRYFLAQMPANLVRFSLLVVVLIPFARGHSPQRDMTTPDLPEPMTKPQKHLLTLLIIAIVLWASDSLHGISPAWIGLAAAAVLLLPGIGMLSKDAMKRDIDLSPMFFLSGIFALSAVVRHVGLDAMVGNRLIPYLALEGGTALHNLYAITGFSTLMSHLTTAPAAPAVLAPLAGAMADAAKMPVNTVAMAQMIGIATPILPYQAPPLIVAMALTHIPVAVLTRVCVVVTVGVFALGLPLTYVFWRLIGLL